MTQQRRDENSTQFGIWLRKQNPIDSSRGFVATNLDFIWENHKTGQFMFLEEKRNNGTLEFYQKRNFKRLHEDSKGNKNYCGFHCIKFENTCPEDGRMWLDGKEIQVGQLISFLRFENVSLRAQWEEE